MTRQQLIEVLQSDYGPEDDVEIRMRHNGENLHLALTGTYGTVCDVNSTDQYVILGAKVV